MGIDNISIPKQRFFTGISLIYLFAFTSLYIQLPALYSDNGVTPVRLEKLTKPDDVFAFIEYPNLLRLSTVVNLSSYHALELCVLFGAVLSFLCVFVDSCRGFISFTMLWLLYFSAFKVGNVFLWFQWDILLLEAGFITILLSGLPLIRLFGPHAPSDNIGLWLLRWLLFRLMFSAGVVKLTSGCPTWWGLTALNWHYQSQCIPSPLAWYMHQLPEWFHKLCVAATLVIEIPLPMLFFVPLQTVRLFSFYAQLLLQVMIILTGNYNFFNLLTITLCYSLLKNEDFAGASTKRRKNPSATGVSILLSVCIIGAVLAFSSYFFGLSVSNDYTSIKTSIGFSTAEFNKFLHIAVPYSIYFGVGLYFLQLISSLIQAITSRRNGLHKLSDLTGVLLVGSIGMALVFGSLVPLASLDKTAVSQLPTAVHKVYRTMEPYQLVNSYGLFRRMTGVGGRPELVVEWAPDETGPWTEYEFHFKPGSVSRMPPIVAPHQPRVDWQMWFAALGSHENNPWFMNLVYRLLQKQPAVLPLMANERLPTDAKFIRARLYTYRFTTPSSKSPNWWERGKPSEYLAPVSLGSPLLRSAVSKSGLGGRLQAPPVNQISQSLDNLRRVIGQPKDLSPLLIVCFMLMLTRYAFNSAGSSGN